MNASSQIISGGGWEETRSVRVKFKAWTSLIASLGLGGLALNGSDSSWVIGIGIAAVSSLSASIRWFVRERPRMFTFLWSREKHDLRNLYGVCGEATGMEQKAAKEANGD